MRLVIDAIGSWQTPAAYFDGLREAVGEVAWYQPVRRHTLKRFNNRTHRELIVVDGEVAFVCGAGIASWWDTGPPAQPPWRDTMVRLEGTIATSVQAAFAENWLECSGKLLTDLESVRDSVIFEVEGSRMLRDARSGRAGVRSGLQRLV